MPATKVGKTIRTMCLFGFTCTVYDVALDQGSSKVWKLNLNINSVTQITANIPDSVKGALTQSESLRRVVFLRFPQSDHIQSCLQLGQPLPASVPKTGKPQVGHDHNKFHHCSGCSQVRHCRDSLPADCSQQCCSVERSPRHRCQPRPNSGYGAIADCHATTSIVNTTTIA